MTCLMFSLKLYRIQTWNVTSIRMTHDIPILQNNLLLPKGLSTRLSVPRLLADQHHCHIHCFLARPSGSPTSKQSAQSTNRLKDESEKLNYYRYLIVWTQMIQLTEDAFFARMCDALPSHTYRHDRVRSRAAMWAEMLSRSHRSRCHWMSVDPS